MEISTLCTFLASLGVFPNRSQFFQYESASFSLDCSQEGGASGWTVRRNTSKQVNQVCPASSGPGPSCSFDFLYETDSGVYWCESEAGELSNLINVTVTAGPLILEIPALPVAEGEAVSLRCRSWTTWSENLTTRFYKDELLIRSSSAGNIVTLHSVSRSDEGLYKCLVSGVGESPSSWLTVRGRLLPSRRSALALLLLPVTFGVSLVSLMLLCLWRNHRDDFNSTVVMFTENTRRMCSVKGLQRRRRRSFSSFSSTVVYRPVRTGTPAHVWVYEASRGEPKRR